MPILNDFELACLYAADGDESKMEKMLGDATARLVKEGLLRPDSGADGAGDTITPAGKHFLASNANNRGIV